MIDIATESDTDILRQVALLLDRENSRLIGKNRDLFRELAQLRGIEMTAELELEGLKELLARRERALFADSSEKRPGGNEKDPEAPLPQTGHGPKEQAQLPLVEQIHELDEADRACPACGGELSAMEGQFEESEEVTLVERRFVLVRHRRKKYRCKCGGCVETAPGPLKLIAGGRYSVEFAVEVATNKYLDHLPLERQARIMKREGLEVGSQTLFDQIAALTRLLEPTYEAIGRQVLKAGVVGADETHWRLMGKSGEPGKINKRYWMWNVNSPEASFHRILASRSKSAAKEVLGDYRGIVMVDGYGAYAALAEDARGRGSPFLLAHCWAHVRRKFIEIEENFPGPCREILDLIGELYAVEREVPATAESGALRADLRRDRSAPIARRIRDWAFAQHAIPQTGLAKAIAYMLGLWEGLTRFLEDSRIPLDNNASERALRGPVIGRKNHYGSRSLRGTQVAAILYTLLETAKLAGVEPKSYLLAAARAAIRNPGTVTLPATLAAAG